VTRPSLEYLIPLVSPEYAARTMKTFETLVRLFQVILAPGAPAFDFVNITNALGAPLFVQFAKGGYPNADSVRFWAKPQPLTRPESRNFLTLCPLRSRHFSTAQCDI